VQSILTKYKPVSNFDDQKKNDFYSWKNLLSLPVMPISLQYENIKNYIVKDVKFSTNKSENNESEKDDNSEMVGKITKRERKEIVERYLEKKKRRNWKTIRYEIRKDLAEKRMRFHGRFVKNNKKSITELAKAYQFENNSSMTLSGLSSEINSRKDSVTNLITPMKQLNIQWENRSLPDNNST